jgi:hypothetical protein
MVTIDPLEWVKVDFKLHLNKYWIFFRTLWKKCSFSGDGEYICAGSARQHALYIWEKSVGNLVKILHGTKGELLLDVVVSGLLLQVIFVIPIPWAWVILFYHKSIQILQLFPLK